jgi:hypothetical protein
VTEQTPPSGADQPRGARDQYEPAGRAPDDVPAAGKGRFSEGQEDHPGNRPDETRDETAAARREAALTSGVRRCACCGRPLPPPTRDARKPRKYCLDGQGGLEERYGVTCTKFGPVKEEYERVLGRDAVGGEDLDRLGEQITAAQDLLGPASPLAGLLTALGGTLTGVGDRLEEAVTDALDQAAKAATAEREALGREQAAIRERDVATEQANEAILARQAAERERDNQVRVARQRATDAESAQRHAENEQARLRGETTQLEGRAQRADEAAARDRDRAERAKRTVARQAAKIVELTGQLAEANVRAAAERDRADAADAAMRELTETTATRIATIQAQTAQEIDSVRTAAEQRVSEAHIATTRALTEHGDELRRIDRERADDRAAWQRSIADARHVLDQVRLGVQALLRTQPDPDVPPSASEQRLRTGLTDLIDGWTLPPEQE